MARKKDRYKRFNKEQWLVMRAAAVGLIVILLIAMISCGRNKGKVKDLKAELSSISEVMAQTTAPVTQSAAVAYQTDIYGEYLTDTNGQMIPVTEVATEKSGIQYKVTATNGLNLRSMASTDGTALTTIPLGTTVTVTSKNADGTWGAVSYNGQGGWISLDSTLVEQLATPVVTTTAAQ